MDIHIEPHELFFSTTDARGVIEKANEVFVRLSGHPWSELVGAPHNIIRHDEMPGGAFRLMWQTLQAGDPFCAYVVNRAASGDEYRVFATITPLGDGYLSVRSKPCADTFANAAWHLYHPARQAERDARAAGSSAIDAATTGLDHLAQGLAGAGFATYTDFMHAALPAEVEARSSMVPRLQSRFGDGPLYGLFREVQRVNTQLTSWRDEMRRLASLVTALRAGVEDLRAATHSSGELVEQVVAEGHSGPAMLAVNVWASMVPEIEAAQHEVFDEVKDLAASCAETRFHLALAQLHNDTTAQFVVELLDWVEGISGDEPQGSGVAAIADLTRALDEGLRHAAARATRNAELASQVATSLDAVRELLGVPQSLLAGWQDQMGGREDDALATMLPRMAQQLDDGECASATLGALAQQCRDLARPLDLGAMNAALGQARSLAAAAARGETPAVDDDEPVVPVRARRGM